MATARKSTDDELPKGMNVEAFLAWYEHPSEALCRDEQIEDCLRSVAPHDIVITDVRTDRQSSVGIYVNAYSHEVEISRSVITGTGHGPGIYLDSGHHIEASLLEAKA